MFGHSGAVTSVNESAMDETLTFHFFIEGHLLAWQPLCEADCSMTLTDLETEATSIFDLGAYTDIPRPVYLHDSQLVVVIGGREFVRLSTDAPPESLGYWDPRFIGPDMLSPDGSWSVLLDVEEDPKNLVFWDHQVEAPAFVYPIEQMPFISSVADDDRFVIRFSSADADLLVVNQTENTLTTWPPLDIEGAVIEFLLSDTQALVWSGGREIEAGIHLLDHDSGAMTMLLPGNVRLLNGRDIDEVVERQRRM